MTIGERYVDLAGRVTEIAAEHGVDVWVPPEVAQQRIAAAVDAGGIVVDDSQAPSYTVIADQDGNKACVCTALPPATKR